MVVVVLLRAPWDVLVPDAQQAALCTQANTGWDTQFHGKNSSFCSVFPFKYTAGFWAYVQ